LTPDPALEALVALLKDTQLEIKDSKVAEKLAKAQELVNNVKVRSKGILTKFCLDGQVALVTGGGQGKLTHKCFVYYDHLMI
jgi:hypothetical protein